MRGSEVRYGRIVGEFFFRLVMVPLMGLFGTYLSGVTGA